MISGLFFNRDTVRPVSDFCRGIRQVCLFFRFAATIKHMAEQKRQMQDPHQNQRVQDIPPPVCLILKAEIRHKNQSHIIIEVMHDYGNPDVACFQIAIGNKDSQADAGDLLQQNALERCIRRIIVNVRGAKWSCR